MVRVTKFRAEDALSVLEAARDNNDFAVITACLRVREGWLLGRRVPRADLDLIAEFVQ
jgi:hypothetical protein